MDYERPVLFAVFVLFFLAIGVISLLVLTGVIRRADRGFRKWAVGGFVATVTAALVGLFQSDFRVDSSSLTVTLVPDPPLTDVGLLLQLEHGTYEYDESVSVGKPVQTRTGAVTAVPGGGGSLLVRLPHELAGKGVKLEFQDASKNRYATGKFFTDTLEQKMYANQGPPAAPTVPSKLPAPIALALVPGLATAAAAQQQASTKFNNYTRSIGKQGGREYDEWRVFVDERPEVLKTIQQVDYELHPTFPSPFRTSRDRDKNFELITSGWGTFQILITVHYTTGAVAKTSYMLDFTRPWPSTQLSASPRLDSIHVVQSGSTAAAGWSFEILVNGKPALKLAARNYDARPGKNDCLPGPGDRWTLETLKAESGRSVHIEVRGRRTSGNDSAFGAGDLTANGGSVKVTVTNSTDKRKGSFVFTFSAARAADPRS